MKTEYEATFLNVNKNEIKEKLKVSGAKLVKSEFLQKRVVFDLPSGYDGERWLRVRDEGDRITMSYKKISGKNIDDQKETQLVIDDFKSGVEFLNAIGCREKSYQETKRELWELNGVEICIDEWPFLEPFVEVEGKSEKDVKDVSKKIGFDYSTAWFCATTLIYSKKYNIPREVIDQMPKIVFDMDNPFLKAKKSAG